MTIRVERLRTDLQSTTSSRRFLPNGPPERSTKQVLSKTVAAQCARPRDFMVMRHLIPRGTNFEIGRAPGKLAGRPLRLGSSDGRVARNQLAPAAMPEARADIAAG